MPNKALRRTAIPLRSIAAGELLRSAVEARQLEPLPLIVHRIVLRHHPLFLHTQNIREMRADPRHKRGARQVAVGRRHLRDPGQGQLFGHPILEGAEDPLRPAPRLRGIRGNEREPQLL